jgi:hypothetical protein
VRHPEQRADLAHRQVRAPVRGDQQHPVGEVQGPLPARPAVGDALTATLGDQPDQLAELGGLQPGERKDPLRAGRRDHLHPGILTHRPQQTDAGGYETSLSVAPLLD